MDSKSQYRSKSKGRSLSISESNSGSSRSGPIVSENNNYGFKNNVNIEELKYLESFPPGYRFHPEDSELILHYLNKKVTLEELPPNNIQEVILYNHNPDELIENHHPIKGEKEQQYWFFFTPRDRKFQNGTRPNRAAGDGFWKASGGDKPIIDNNGITVWFRKSLVFWRGKDNKTDWLMHEYRVNEPPRRKMGANDMRLDDWVLCKVYKRKVKATTTQDTDDDQGNGHGPYQEEITLPIFNSSSYGAPLPTVIQGPPLFGSPPPIRFDQQPMDGAQPMTDHRPTTSSTNVDSIDLTLHL